ncbi:MAG: large-conductance mechanosensitive channel protein MscL [Gammaproteobacteria bacterium]|nr:large-conductance mechanosensitive channel protein MscL [Gammaproteobacteria bacterium]
MIEEFKKFIMRGNVIDMAVGIVIGAAFGTIIKSLVADVIMPPVGVLLGNVDFSNLFLVIKEGVSAGPYASIAAAKEAGAVTMNWGLFVNTVISFLIVSAAIFALIKAVNKLEKDAESEPEPAPAEPEPSPEEVLLTEIRDLLSRP